MVSVLTTWPQTNGMRPRKHSRLTALSHISVVSKKFHFHLILFCQYSHIQHLNSNWLSLTCRLSAVIAVFRGANKHVKNSKASCNQGDQGDQDDPGECCDQHDNGDIPIPLIDSAHLENKVLTHQAQNASHEDNPATGYSRVPGTFYICPLYIRLWNAVNKIEYYIYHWPHIRYFIYWKMRPPRIVDLLLER